MKFDRQIRKIVLDSTERLEIIIVNFAQKVYQNLSLIFRYSKKTDHIGKIYKKEICEYWNRYKKISTRWHKHYSSKNGIHDVRYIPNDLYYTDIDQYFNDRKLGWGFADKNYYSLILNRIKQPVTILRKINGILLDSDYNLIKLSDAIELLKKHDEIICKPSIESGSGKGIKFYRTDEHIGNITKILLDNNNKNIIMQEVIQQHSELSSIHPSSLNTIRIVSLIMNDEINILSSCLRMGVNKSRIDNASAGGISCGIDKSGILKKHAYTCYGGNIYQYHPQGFEFKGFRVPSYEKAIDLVKKTHPILSHFRLVSWDIAIDINEEPILIEANTRQGGINIHQINNGPLFGELTGQILEEIY